MTHRSRSLVSRAVLAAMVAATILLPATAHAQSRLPSSSFKNGSSVRKAFKKVVETANRATVAVFAKGKQVALGAVVESDGYILTKASELKGTVKCKFRDGRTFEARIIGIARDEDLALVKIDVDELETVEWRTGDDPHLGNWLATPGLKAAPVAVGVLSVKRRRIPAPRPLLGVQLEERVPRAVISRVNPNSGADKAGLKAGDVITWMGGTAIKDLNSLRKQIRKFHIGDTVELRVLRNDKELKLKARLGSSLNPRSRGAIQNSMVKWGLSKRRYGFPEVFQHDTFLRPEHCGGPIVDLNGRVVGINIARAGRTESYAIPANRIQKLLPDLRSGKLAPPIVAKQPPPPAGPVDLKPKKTKK